MNTRKYESPLGGDIGTSKATKGRGWKGLKGQMALALAVSLWIGGAGVASASDWIYLDVNNNDALHKDGTPPTAPSKSGKTLTITGGTSWNSWIFKGGLSGSSAVEGYTLNLSGVKGTFSAEGGNTYSNTVSGNTVDGTNIETNDAIRGGISMNSQAYSNTVRLKNSTVGSVSGSEGGTGANNSSVTLENTTVNDNDYGVYGGSTFSGTATGNTVTLKNSTITNSIYGGYNNASATDVVTGNTLNLSGANTARAVQNFATININSATWGTSALTLTGDGIVQNADGSTYATINTQNVAFSGAPTTGTTTLISSTNALPNTLKVFTGATAKATITTAGVVVKQDATPTESKANGVTLAYRNTHTVALAADSKSITYNIANPVSTIALGSIDWVKDGTARTLTTEEKALLTFNSDTAIDKTGFAFTNPWLVGAGESMTLLANATLAEMAATENNVSFSYVPVAGVTMDGKILGSYASSGGNLTYTATANQATKLTFGNVAWKDTGALMTRPANITFAGADVDTSNINFTNIKELEANKTMTLVSDFGNSVGAITGTKYKVGSTLQGEGKASLKGNNLIFTTDTRAEKMTVQEQTHNTVMGAEVGMAALSAGNDFVGAATEGLAMAGNTGADGMATYANMGGGSMNVETGSHVKTHTWNAILALGHKNEKKLSTTEYGAFFEYGTGNYSTFNGDERGDGSTRYTGGGILGKWQKNNGLYVEGSLRAGSIHDDANNVLRDVNGNPYSYTTDATYWGAHIGVGREIKLNKTDVLDLYAKYFYNHRGSVSFDAGGHYDLGAVESSVLRVGTRYTVKQNDNINYYGGLAVEHEFCGRASGFADGVAIRGADISGTSVRGEIGATFRPGEKSNVTLDLNLSGFAGKKQGLTGGLSAVFHI